MDMVSVPVPVAEYLNVLRCRERLRHLFSRLICGAVNGDACGSELSEAGVVEEVCPDILPRFPFCEIKGSHLDEMRAESDIWKHPSTFMHAPRTPQGCRLTFLPAFPLI
jgi:hypothetical protein